jgi:hypothetical protein
LILHRIFDSHNVRRAVRIDEIDQRSQSGSLAATGGPRHQHQSLPAIRKFGERDGKMQRFERWKPRAQQPDTGRERSALMMDVDAETAEAFAHESHVDRFALLQLVELRRFEQQRQR